MQVVPSPGSVIASRFRVESEVGRGAMGIVLRGRDEANRPVAIKVLLPEAIEHPEAVPRFVNEARAARELTSEHSVRVIDAGTLDTGLPFMVMELLEGNDLATQLEQGGPFAISDACDAIIDACDALAEAHSRGMVHRDIKPANLFAARDPSGRVRVKVLDFGLSKVAAQIRSMSLTSTGTALGTPHYMAPEQLKSAKDVDGRADIWSLGVVLYELLGKDVPFDGKSFGHLFMQIVAEDARPLTTLRPDVPPGVVEIIDRCMKKNRDDRYADVMELVGSLARFASPSGQAAAQRIKDGRGAPRAPLESVPMVPVVAKHKGTLLMASSPAQMQAQLEAQRALQAARASSPDHTPLAPPPAPAPMPGSDGRLSTPDPVPYDSGRFAAPMAYAQPAPQGMAVPAPQAAPAPVRAEKKLSTGVILAVLAAFGLFLVLGVYLILRAIGR